MNIDLIPDIKKLHHIRGAHKDGKLIVFVGAGLSALWGCKRWNDMAVSLVNSCYESGMIDYWVRENLLKKHSASPRKLITIAKNILGEEKYLEALAGTVEPITQWKERFPNIFTDLFALNAAFVTTNIDSHFSSLFEKNGTHIIPDNFIVKPKNIVHLHGVIHFPDSLVLTIEEYVARYQNDKFRDFLESVFRDEKHCLLFIGYGVDEMEIIDFMIEKYSKRPKPLDFMYRAYILLPFFQNEESMVKYEQLYFDQIKMSIIPYAINARGYDQLSMVVGEWKTDLTSPSKTDEFYRNTILIDGNL